MKKSNMTTFIAFLLVIFMMLALCACGAKNEKAAGKNAQATLNSLYEYAKRLEDAGNYEAAQKVYELIPNAMSGAAIADIESAIGDSTYGDFFQGKQNLEEWKELIESVGDAK